MLKKYFCKTASFILASAVLFMLTGVFYSGTAYADGAFAPETSGSDSSETEGAKNIPELEGGRAFGWPDILLKLKYSDADRFTIYMNGATEAPGELFKELKGKDIELVLEMENGVAWTINGQDITDPKDVDLGIILNTNTIPDGVTSVISGEKSIVQISPAFLGDYGFMAALKFNLGSANSGYYANLYRYNKDTIKLEYCCAAPIGSNGNVSFEVTRAFVYAVAIAENDLGQAAVTVPEEKPPQGIAQEPGRKPADTLPKETEDKILKILWIIVVSIIFVSLAGFLIYVIVNRKGTGNSN